MATAAIDGEKIAWRGRTAPDGYERFLAIASLAMLAVVGAAVARGRPHWNEVPAAVWWHLATIAAALLLTPVMLLRRRGDRIHRILGRVWAALLVATALASFAIRTSRHGHLGPIHILSAWVLVQVPIIVWAARTHRVATHRRGVRAMVTGALLIAGAFTFPFGRMLGRWLFG